jgi:hypothetical protein
MFQRRGKRRPFDATGVPMVGMQSMVASLRRRRAFLQSRDDQHRAIVSPDREHAIFSEHDSERLWLIIDEAAVTRIATALLGEAVDPPVQFEPDIDPRRRTRGRYC